MFESCLKKQEEIKLLFANCSSDTEKYQKIIELGKEQLPIDDKEKKPSNLVSGCQSQMYLSTKLENDKFKFAAESDALISAGLAALLIRVYNNENLETILKCPPKFIEDLKLAQSLTPSRANGLASLFLKMQQDAIKAQIG